MQVSSADFSATSMHRNIASEQARENPHARHLAQAEEEKKIDELRTAEENTAEQADPISAIAVKPNNEAGFAQHGGHNHGSNSHGGSEHGHDAALSGKPEGIEKRVQELLQKQEDKAVLFDSSGQTTKPKPESSILDIFG